MAVNEASVTSPPSLRVRELCEAVEGVSGEGAEGVVMLTSEGQQMEPNELIGRYSVGTVRLDLGGRALNTPLLGYCLLPYSYRCLVMLNDFAHLVVLDGTYLHAADCMQ